MDIPSPAISIVGRHNSGKTTLIEKLISELVSRGLDIGSVKHHGHKGFDIDIPGKDSYRHRAAGASETVIAAPGQIARIKTISGDSECQDIVQSMPNHDLVIVEGYRKSGLPTIEIMREANEADRLVAHAFIEGANNHVPLNTDFVQAARAVQHGANSPVSQSNITDTQHVGDYENSEHGQSHGYNPATDLVNKMPLASTVAVVTDIPSVHKAAAVYSIPSFDFDDVVRLADFVQDTYAMPKLTVVIQAGGESRRMGRSKATVPFQGKPLISRLVDRLHTVADELIITTNEPENLGFLAEEFPELNITLVRDAFDYRGALPGLYTALQAASNPLVAIVACDMVCASPRLINAEVVELISTGADAVVPNNKNGFEPFHAVYRKESCFAAVKSLVTSGSKRASDMFERITIAPFTMTRVRKAEPEGWCFANANTPEELALLEKMLSKE